MTVVRKSLGAGIPLSGVVRKAEVMDDPAVKELGTTLGRNALGCVTGLELIRQALDFPSKYIGEVRGLGAMVGIECVKDKSSKAPYSEFVKQVVAEYHLNGVIVITVGATGNVIRLLPRLTITAGGSTGRDCSSNEKIRA